MARCDVCGNDYDKVFRVIQGDLTMTFDSFECAIHALAPRCTHCTCRVVGHGIEAGGKVYCWTDGFADAATQKRHGITHVGRALDRQVVYARGAAAMTRLP